MDGKEFMKRYDEFYSAFYAFALKLTRDSEEAEDLIQESTYKAYKYRDSFSEGTNFKSWVNTIIKNTFINRYHKRRKRNVVNQPIEDFTFALESKYAVGNMAIHNMSLEQINMIINGISNKYSHSFKMFYEGYSYEEIASITEVPIGTVKSRIFTARKKITEELVKQDLL